LVWFPKPRALIWAAKEKIMRLNRPLLRLPIRFNADKLAAEVSGLPRSAWVAHPNAFPGNNAVRLITTGGLPTDALGGGMAPTEYLRACPYVMELMSELECTWGRSRFMGLAPGAEVPPHIDSHYYWRTHIRIHIPVITNPGVEFTCGGETVHMKPGECWVFDSFQLHEVHNRGDVHRTHLVIDTVGGGKLWDLIEQAQGEAPPEPRLFSPGDGQGAPLLFERVNTPKVMTPWELQAHIRFLESLALPHPALDRVMRRLNRLAFDWGAIWAAYSDSPEGLPAYEKLLRGAAQDLGPLGIKDLYLTNKLPLHRVLISLVFEVLIAPADESLRTPARQAAAVG